jgi:hypothetical protein
LTAAAANESPNESCKACSTRRLAMMPMNCPNESSAALRKSAASGISTISESQSRLIPSVTPKPGITLRLRWIAVPLTAASFYCV